MQDFGKMLVVLGLAVALVGLVMWSGLGKTWLGKLPGDIRYTRENFGFYFPLATSILVSLALTLLLWLFRR